MSRNVLTGFVNDDDEEVELRYQTDDLCTVLFDRLSQQRAGSYM